MYNLWREIQRSNARQDTEIVEASRSVYDGPLSLQAVIRSALSTTACHRTSRFTTSVC